MDAAAAFVPQPAVPLPPEQRAIADVILADSVADIGAPSLEHYRRAYDNLGLPWPEDDEVRLLHPVDDGATVGEW